MHIDMDCFFASVGLRDRPGLREKPVVVAHALTGSAYGIEHSSTSELASCNYVARTYGIKNGMFLGQAQALCPQQLVVIPYEYDKYDAVSKTLYHILLLHSNYVQAISCDEAYVDITFKIQDLLQQERINFVDSKVSNKVVNKTKLKSTFLYDEIDPDEEDDEEYHDDYAHHNTRVQMGNKARKGSANDNDSILRRVDQLSLQIAQQIRKEIFLQTGCNASIGIGSNMLLARIATQKAKPNNVFSLVQSVDVSALLSALAIRDLPGVGYVTAKKCEEVLSLKTCGDIINPPSQLAAKVGSKEGMLTLLQKELGVKTGSTIYQFAQGKDDRSLVNIARQSIGSDVNWGIRFTKQEEVDRFLLEFCQEVHHRLVSLQQNYGTTSELELTSKSSHVSTFVVSHVIVCVKKKLYEGEPGKFLGCGHCQDYSKSFIVNKKVARLLLFASVDSSNITNGIDDGELKGHLLLFSIVSQMYKEIGIEIDEVRGVGIHLKRDMSNVQQAEASTTSSTGSKLANFFQGKNETIKPKIEKEELNEEEDLFGLIDADLGEESNEPRLEVLDNMVEAEKTVVTTVTHAQSELLSKTSHAADSNEILPKKTISDENGVLTSPSKRAKLVQQQKQENLIRAFLSRPGTKSDNTNVQQKSVSLFLSDDNDSQELHTSSKGLDFSLGYSTSRGLENTTTNEVIELFTASPVTPVKSNKPHNSSHSNHPLNGKFDSNALNELPEEIRKEVLLERNNSLHTSSSPKAEVGTKRLVEESQSLAGPSKKLITSFFQSNTTSPPRTLPMKFTGTKAVSSPPTKINKLSFPSSTTSTSSWNLDHEIRMLHKLFIEKKGGKEKDFGSFVDINVLKELPIDIAKEQLQHLTIQLKLIKK